MGGDNFAELFKGPDIYDDIQGSKPRDYPEQTWTAASKAKRGPALKKCLVCGEMCPELESRSRMCPPCIRSEGVERVDCQFCLLDFFTKGRKANTGCYQCSKLRTANGEPRRCVVCKNHACFSSPGITDMCGFCHSSHQKYGEPKNCDSCGTKSAFDKPEGSAKKVNNRSLCLRCTRRHKLKAHRDKKNRRPTKEELKKKAKEKVKAEAKRAAKKEAAKKEAANKEAAKKDDSAPNNDPRTADRSGAARREAIPNHPLFNPQSHNNHHNNHRSASPPPPAPSPPRGRSRSHSRGRDSRSPSRSPPAKVRRLSRFSSGPAAADPPPPPPPPPAMHDTRRDTGRDSQMQPRDPEPRKRSRWGDAKSDPPAAGGWGGSQGVDFSKRQRSPRRSPRSDSPPCSPNWRDRDDRGKGKSDKGKGKGKGKSGKGKGKGKGNSPMMRGKAGPSDRDSQTRNDSSSRGLDWGNKSQSESASAPGGWGGGSNTARRSDPRQQSNPAPNDQKKLADDYEAMFGKPAAPAAATPAAAPAAPAAAAGWVPPPPGPPPPGTPAAAIGRPPAPTSPALSRPPGAWNSHRASGSQALPGLQHRQPDQPPPPPGDPSPAPQPGGPPPPPPAGNNAPPPPPAGNGAPPPPPKESSEDLLARVAALLPESAKAKK